MYICGAVNIFIQQRERSELILFNFFVADKNEVYYKSVRETKKKYYLKSRGNPPRSANSLKIPPRDVDFLSVKNRGRMRAAGRDTSKSQVIEFRSRIPLSYTFDELVRISHCTKSSHFYFFYSILFLFFCPAHTSVLRTRFLFCLFCQSLSIADG